MYYGAIDLHSNMSVLVVIDENDEIVIERKVTNNIADFLDSLSILRDKKKLKGIAVESTYNWYWLVDGLEEAGYHMSLVNTSAVKQYEGIKYRNDKDDAFWLAHLMRLGILPTGYIYPKEERAVRDMLRKRMLLVRQRTMNILSIENQLTRLTGKQFNSNFVMKLTTEQIAEKIDDPNNQLTINCQVGVIRAQTHHIKKIEQAVTEQVKLKSEYQHLLAISGIGVTLAQTIMLETGDIHRFKQVGNYASYCRCVKSSYISNNKQKGKGNTKNGNKYLAWAFMEAANFAIRFSKKAQQFYQRKANKTKPVIARKALAHKLARACYYVLKNNEAFDEDKLYSA